MKDFERGFDMKKETEILLEKYQTLLREIIEIKKRADKIELKLNEIRFGYKIGDEIKYEEVRGKVTGLGLWLRFAPYKKDGTLAKYAKNAYNLNPKFELD